MGLLMLAVATWLGLGLASASEEAANSSRICQEAPAWTINGSSPMEGAAGQVTVVALLKQSPPARGRRAALPRHPLPAPRPHSLGGLRERLARQGTADVRYMIVNEKAPLSRAMLPELQRHAPPGVPVFQPEQEDPDVWQVLGGDKDDFLVYDRCGRLAFHIQLPFSFLHFPYVESAIRSSLVKDFCGNCSLYPNTTREVRAGMLSGAKTPSVLKDTNPSEDHKPVTHAHHHHGDHGQLHHKGKKQKEGDEH
uniref:Selenoprotein P N-terminal domain-containing protein n=1 Tax=Malurus cyaneus samueli TaxID=2593467 RepID=A0A8C5TT89_9PASS